MGIAVTIIVIAYALVGAAVAIAFAVAWAPRLATPLAPVSTGARLLLAPGAALLWPLILRRCLALRDR